MPCHRTQLGDGVSAIVCTRGRGRRCIYCGGPASQLCDFPIEGNGKRSTCDAALCRHCTTKLPGDRDLCRSHAALWDFERDRPKVGPGA